MKTTKTAAFKATITLTTGKKFVFARSAKECVGLTNSDLKKEAYAAGQLVARSEGASVRGISFNKTLKEGNK